MDHEKLAAGERQGGQGLHFTAGVQTGALQFECVADDVGWGFVVSGKRCVPDETWPGLRNLFNDCSEAPLPSVDQNTAWSPRSVATPPLIRAA